jgi:MFS transporter, DHA1 family, tetracycline resistance protein
MLKAQPRMGFIFVTLFLDVVGLGIIIPVLPKLIETLMQNDLGSASSMYGILIAVYALMQFLFAPVLGSLSDQFGRRPVILISLLGGGIDYLVMGFAPSIEWLLVGRVISGLTSANFTAVSAYIADVSPPEKRAQNFGMLGAAFGLGFIVGPAIGGLLGNVGLRVPFFVVAGISLLNTLYGFFVLPESLAPQNRRRFDWKRGNPVGSLLDIRRYPTVLSLAFVIFLSGLGQNILQSIWVLYTGFRYNWGPGEVGISLAVVGFSALLVQIFLIGRIVTRLGEARALIFGLIISIISFTLYGLAPFGWMFYVIPFFGALSFVANPSAQAIVSKSILPSEQGAVQGSLTSILSLTGIIGPLIATSVFRYFISPEAPVILPGAPFFLGAIFTLISLFVAGRAFAGHVPQPQAET